MAGLLQRVFGGTPTPPPNPQRTRSLAAAVAQAHALRRFDGATVDRLTAGWKTTNQAIDQELRRDLDRLRARSRDLFKNDAYAAKFGRMVRNNVVGPEGFTLHARSADPGGKLDKLANTAIENGFWDWCSPRHCDVRAQRAFVDICRSVALAVARDGEGLVRKVRNRGKYGLQLQLLNVDRLDTNYNLAPADNRNAVIMGVEVDEALTPVAYHILTSLPGAGTSLQGKRKRERVPADEIYHVFVPMEEEQTRGVPWLHAAMRILNDLKGYREAAVIAARVGAAKMGVWQTPDGGPPPGSETDPTGEGVDAGSYITDAEPGHFDYAPPGYQLTTYDPTYPHDQFDAFCKATLRGIASATGVSYSGLANDLTDVSFSSIRSGTLEERDEWMVVQNILINQFMTPVYEDWVEMGLMRGAILLPNGSALPATKKDKFLTHLWQGRRWQWVDPMKDIEAAILAIANGLASPQQIAMQVGRDVEDILDDIAVFQQLAKARGVELPMFGKPQPTTGKSASDGSG